MNNFTSPIGQFFTALNHGFSVANLCSFVAEQSGPKAYAGCKNWKVEEIREEISKIMTFFDFVSCVSITCSLLSRGATQEEPEVNNTTTGLGFTLFAGASIAAICATNYSQKFHSRLHSDVYQAVENKQPQVDEQGRNFLTSSKAGMSSSDFAQQSLLTMRSIVNFTAGCLIANLSPFQRRAYFLSAIINALSVSVIFQRVSLLFQFSEIRQVPSSVYEEGVERNMFGRVAHTLILMPTVEYRILRPLFEKMGRSNESEEDCPICLEDLKEKVALCPNHSLHTECIYEYCLSKLNDYKFRQELHTHCELTKIEKKGVRASPTASFFEAIGCPSRVASRMSISVLDNAATKRDNKNNATGRDNEKSDLVIYDNQIKPPLCWCRAPSPYIDYQLEASTITGKKLPVEGRNLSSNDL